MAQIYRCCKLSLNFLNSIKPIRFVHQPVRTSYLNVYRNWNFLIYSKRDLTTNNAISKVRPIDIEFQKIRESAEFVQRISRENVNIVMKNIEEDKELTSSKILFAFQCCGKLLAEEPANVRTKMAQDLWLVLLSYEAPLHVSYFNALLTVYIENDHRFSVDEILSEMRRAGVKPDILTYQRIIEGHCLAGDMIAANQMIMYFNQNNITLTKPMYDALILGHGRAGDIRSAKDILKLMEGNNVLADNETYTCLLRAFAFFGGIKAIEEKLAQHRKKQSMIKLLDEDILKVIGDLAMYGHGDKVDSLIKYINHSKDTWYHKKARNMILHLVNYGLDEIAYKILKTMDKKELNSGSLSGTGSFLVKHYVKLNRPVNTIFELCGRLERDGKNTPSLHSLHNPYMTLMCSLCEKGSIDEALGVLNNLKSISYRITERLFHPLFRKAGSEQTSWALLNAMVNRFNIMPTPRMVREYLVSALGVDSPVRTRNYLTEVGISKTAAESAIVLHTLEKRRLKDAADLSIEYEVYIYPRLFEKELIECLHTKYDSINFTRFLRNYSEQNLKRSKRDSNSNEKKMENPREAVGRILFTVLTQIPPEKRINIFAVILNEFAKEKLIISREQVRRIIIWLRQDATDEIVRLLTQIEDKSDGNE